MPLYTYFVIITSTQEENKALFSKTFSCYNNVNIVVMINVGTLLYKSFYSKIVEMIIQLQG